MDKKLIDPFRVLFEVNPMPMWIFDAVTLRFLAVNNAAIRHYGYSLEEFLQMTLRDIRPPEDIPKFEHVVAHLPVGKVLSPVGEWRHVRRDGSIVCVEVCSHPVD